MGIITRLKDRAIEYAVDALLGVNRKRRSMSEKRVEAELAEVEKAASAAYKRINKQTGFGRLNYYKQIKELINSKAETDDERRLKLSALADFLTDDSVRTVKGQRTEMKNWLKENRQAVDTAKARGLFKRDFDAYVDFQNFRGERHAQMLDDAKFGYSATKRFLNWKNIRTLDELGDTETIELEMWKWHREGQPDNTGK